ncbi:NXPE family member 1-like [Branchiostoma floridae x Branchiostoma japonicum]
MSCTMKASRMCVSLLPILGLLLVFLFLKSKPIIFDINPNEMVPKQIFWWDAVRQNISEAAIFSGDCLPVTPKGIIKLKCIKKSPLKEKRKENAADSNASYKTDVQTISSKEKERLLTSHIPSRVDIRKNIAGNDEIFSSSPTSSEKTIAHVLNRRPTYRVGDKLLLKIVARNAFSRSKTTGGDFFITQLFSTYPVHASTAGRITDYGNGTYIARFILGWPGIVTAEVRLIHSSEAVSVLQESRKSKVRRFFSCHFFDAKTNESEWTSCSFNENERSDYSENICDFSRSDINVTWYCHKPRNVGCNGLFECRQDRNKSFRVDDMFTEEEKISIKGYM